MYKHSMRQITLRVRLSISLTLLFFSIFAYHHLLAADETAEKEAVKASESWLSLVDEGKYSESWEEASQYFKVAVSKKQWRASLIAVRTPLGKVISRKLKSQQYSRSLPDAPDGEYVVIQYNTSFENKRSAVETITPMLDKDGIWRVSGYYIK